MKILILFTANSTFSRLLLTKISISEDTLDKFAITESILTLFSSVKTPWYSLTVWVSSYIASSIALLDDSKFPIYNSDKP